MLIIKLFFLNREGQTITLKDFYSWLSYFTVENHISLKNILTRYARVRLNNEVLKDFLDRILFEIYVEYVEKGLNLEDNIYFMIFMYDHQMVRLTEKLDMMYALFFDTTIDFTVAQKWKIEFNESTALELQKSYLHEFISALYNIEAVRLKETDINRFIRFPKAEDALKKMQDLLLFGAKDYTQEEYLEVQKSRLAYLFTYTDKNYNQSFIIDNRNTMHIINKSNISLNDVFILKTNE